jgi:hypothetical protein
MVPVFNESYVREILEEADRQPHGLSRDDFYSLCRSDRAAGYLAEVDEAARRYFARRRNPVHGEARQHQ